MSALVFKLKEQPPQRCDLSLLIPDRLADADADSIGQMEIHTTRTRLCVSDVFSVTPGDPTDIIFEGGSERFDNLGAGMSYGRIHATADLGQRTGRGMSGGEIVADGSVGRLAGAGMSGGRLEIGGDAGDLVGAPLPGEASGMTGGLIHVHGCAGACVGDRMRRGLIAIDHDVGMHLACRMVGGTIACLGRAGALPGYLMSRGTVVVGQGAESTSPTFVDSGYHELVALRLISRWLIEEGIEGGSLVSSRLRRLVGDTAVLGKGEIFLPERARG